jgi:adenylate kinase family enzyme
METVKNFINKNSHLLALSSLQAWEQGYQPAMEKGLAVTATYNYFRTQFNKLKQDSGIVMVSDPSQPKFELVTKPDIAFNTVCYENMDDIVLPAMIPVGNLYDKIASDRYGKIEVVDGEEITQPGGFTRKCVDVVAGAPGSGKTTSSNMFLARAVKYHREVLDKPLRAGFISGEMFETEWAKEVKQCELLKEVEVCYFMEEFRKHHMDMTPESFLVILENVIKEYDIVTVDSFPVIMDLYRELDTKITEKQATSLFINFYIEAAHKHNLNIQLINQANKDGNYKGGTLLPHMASSLAFVLKVDGKRFKYFEKNRNNGSTIHQKLFFTKLDDNSIDIDAENYEISYGLKKDENTLEDFLNLVERQPGLISFEHSLNDKQAPDLDVNDEELEDEVEQEPQIVAL